MLSCGETLQHSCLSPDNSLEALFTEVLNCVNSAGHPVIYFTGSVGVFSPYSPGVERYWGKQLCKLYIWVQKGWYLPWHRLVRRIRQAHYVLYSAFILTINIWSWKVSSSGSTGVVLNWERFFSPSGTLGNVLSPNWRGAYPWHVICRSQGCWKSSLHAQEPLWPPTENYPVQSVKFQGLENLHISSIF